MFVHFYHNTQANNANPIETNTLNSDDRGYIHVDVHGLLASNTYMYWKPVSPLIET